MYQCLWLCDINVFFTKTMRGSERVGLNIIYIGEHYVHGDTEQVWYNWHYKEEEYEIRRVVKHTQKLTTFEF